MVPLEVILDGPTREGLYPYRDDGRCMVDSLRSLFSTLKADNLPVLYPFISSTSQTTSTITITTTIREWWSWVCEMRWNGYDHERVWEHTWRLWMWVLHLIVGVFQSRYLLQGLSGRVDLDHLFRRSRTYSQPWCFGSTGRRLRCLDLSGTFRSRWSLEYDARILGSQSSWFAGSWASGRLGTGCRICQWS